MIMFQSLLKQVVVFEAAGAGTKIRSNLKINHHDQVKLVQIPIPHYRVSFIKVSNKRGFYFFYWNFTFFLNSIKNN